MKDLATKNWMQLYPFQQDAITKLINVDRIGLYLDMGLGKTRTSLVYTALKIINNNIDNFILFIISPPQSLKYWEKNVKEFLNPEIKIHIFDDTFDNFVKKKNKQKYEWEQTSVYITTLQRMNDILLEFKKLSKSENVISIIDEAQMLRNQNKTWLRAQRFINESKYLLSLSGDPLGNHLTSMENQMTMLQTKDRPRNFKSTFMQLEETVFWKTVDGKPQRIQQLTYSKNEKPDAIEKIKKLMDYQTVFLKTDDPSVNLYIPEFNVIDVKIPKTKAYEFLEKNKFIDNYEIERAMTSANSFLQMSSGFLYKADIVDEKFITKDYVEKGKTSKLDATLEIINSTYKNIIIYCNFTHEIEMIRKSVEKLGIAVAEISGKRDERGLLNSDERIILLVQYQSGSRSIDGLQDKFDTLIYFSPTLDGELYKQSRKRINRIGQKNSQTFYRLIMENSFDEIVYYEILERAVRLTDTLFNNYLDNGKLENSNIEKEKICIIESRKELIHKFIMEQTEKETGWNETEKQTFQNNNNSDNDGYKKNPVYLELTKKKVADLYNFVDDAGIIGLSKNLTKEELIKQIIIWTETENSDYVENTKTEPVTETQVQPQIQQKPKPDVLEHGNTKHVKYVYFDGTQNQTVTLTAIVGFGKYLFNGTPVDENYIKSWETYLAQIYEIESVISEKSELDKEIQDLQNLQFSENTVSENKPKLDLSKMMTISKQDWMKLGEHAMSYTRLSTFIKNPADYKFKYIDKISPLDQNWSVLVIGQVVHLMIEHNGNQEKVLDEITMDNNYTSITDDAERQDLYRKGVIIGQAALANLNFRKSIAHEPEFTVLLQDGKSYLNGFIDQIYETENGEIGIGEFKTTGMMHTLLAKIPFAKQVHIYAKVVELQTGVRPTEYTYHLFGKPTIKQKKNQTLNEYYQEYAEKMLEKDEYGNFKNLKSITKKFNWDQVEAVWKGVETTLKMINVCKENDSFPIDDDSATSFGKWDYQEFFDGTPESELTKKFLFKKR